MIRYDEGFEELYDLENDPDEFTDLAHSPDHAETEARLSEGIPVHAAPRRGIPKASPCNLNRVCNSPLK
ncbi:hypothetical protein RRSWK_06159 [Rhodopirellula sp. SWK7]|nr:hypothetical protein RRSWK_06159 [Rhodopirellula sp. SWK7]